MGNPDLAMSVLITRDRLSLPDLEINDFVDYYVAGGDGAFLGGQVSWARNQVGSPWVDGQVTVNRQRQMVTQPCTVECVADYPDELQDLQDTLVDAFSQDRFNIQITVGAGAHVATYKLDAEAADYKLAWSGPRWVATQGQVVLSVPCQPVPLVGRSQ